MAADHQVQIIMLGEMSVGKTSLMVRFCKDIFKEDVKTTLIIDNYNKTIVLDDKKIDLQLWDTAGQEIYKAIIKQYYRKADGVILVYDMTDHRTFMEIPTWLRQLRELNEEATVFIVGNKSDLRHLNQVSGTTAENYARDEGLDFCETSAKNNENVDEVFKNLVLKVLKRKKIAPFYEEITNGDIKAANSSNTASVSSEEHVENSLPPIIRLEDGLGSDNDVIKLAMEQPKKKQKKRCC